MGLSVQYPTDTAASSSCTYWKNIHEMTGETAELGQAKLEWEFWVQMETGSDGTETELNLAH